MYHIILFNLPVVEARNRLEGRQDGRVIGWEEAEPRPLPPSLGLVFRERRAGSGRC